LAYGNIQVFTFISKLHAKIRLWLPTGNGDDLTFAALSSGIMVGPCSDTKIGFEKRL
jgi:hypothetical protein